MSKRWIRKNRHRADRGAHRRTWPTCVRTLARALRTKGDAVFTDCEIRIGDQVFVVKDTWVSHVV